MKKRYFVHIVSEMLCKNVKNAVFKILPYINRAAILVAAG